MILFYIASETDEGDSIDLFVNAESATEAVAQWQTYYFDWIDASDQTFEAADTNNEDMAVYAEDVVARVFSLGLSPTSLPRGPIAWPAIPIVALVKTST